MSEMSYSRFSNLILRYNIDLLKREIVLQGTITPGTLTKLDKHLKLLECQPEEGITIVVKTMGGCVESALGIIDRIQMSPCHITTVGTYIVMSAGIPILAAGDTRKATRFTRFMVHNASMSLPYSRMSSAENELKYVKELEKVLNKFLAEQTTTPYSTWSVMGKHVDEYFNSEKAKELGLIGEIIK